MLSAFQGHPLISFSLFPLHSIDKVSKVASPVLVIHGTEDEVIDFSHGLAMYERCPRAVEPLWVEGAGHNDIELYAQYLERLKQFISFELPTSWGELGTQARVHLNTLKKPPPYHLPTSSLSIGAGLESTDHTVLPCPRGHFRVGMCSGLEEEVVLDCWGAAEGKASTGQAWRLG